MSTHQQIKQEKQGIDDFIGGMGPSAAQKAIKENIAKENSREAENILAAGPSTLTTGFGNSSTKKKKQAQKQSVFSGAKSNLVSSTFSVFKHDEHDMNDRAHGLERENLQLKEKENLLVVEIKKMKTKLLHIDELIRSEKHHGGGHGMTDDGFEQLRDELGEEFTNFKDENHGLKDRIRKLKTIATGLSSQIGGGIPTSSATGSKKRPASSMGKKGSFTTSIAMNPQMSGQQQLILTQLRDQLKKNELQILKLTQEKDRLAGTSTGNLTTDDLLRKIRDRDLEIRDITRKYEEIEVQFLKKEKIFHDSNAYMKEVMQQIQEAKLANQTLTHKNMRMHLQFSQSKNLQEQLHNIEREKEQLEQSIRRITSEPFLNREKGGLSVPQRINELMEKLRDKDKHLEVLKGEEYKQLAELKVLEPLVQRMKGSCEQLEKDSKRLKDQFYKTPSYVNEMNVHTSFNKMDPTKYNQALNDVSHTNESYPVWANLDFLERAPKIEDPNGEDAMPNSVNTEIKTLRFEIMKIRHENKDFAAELEKAQNLLNLQRDIDKDNLKYFEAEKERLVLMSRSVEAKTEELARRADDKLRQIDEINKKLNISTMTTQAVNNLPGTTVANKMDKLEVQSEFSAITDESEIGIQENVLDMVVQDAEYFYDAFKTVLDSREFQLNQKSLITFVTLDFYNHDTETSQLAEGVKPLYNTQFSFKNRVDDFYVQYLQKHTMKVDVYISKNNTAVHLGRGEIFLRELLDRETAVQDASFKTPIIQKNVKIYGIKGGISSELPLGQLRFKMRMRKPLGEVVRQIRYKNAVNDATRMEVTGEQSIRNRKKLITIHVVSCRELSVKYSEIANIQPFFYYQFYDFDERYSMTQVGKNPVFEDSRNYTVDFDAKMMNYLTKEKLEIILFDDNAPIRGLERGAQAPGEQADDMIGTASIPLDELIKGSSIYSRFPIRKTVPGMQQAAEQVGEIEVKISIIDLDQGASASMSQATAQAQMMHYTKQWESDLIIRIAKRIARLPGEVELLFGIFSRGQKTVTKEDFKHTCMKRLQLNNDITDREMDMFLKGCPRLIDREIMNLEDFVMIFSSAITQSRHDLQDEEAQQYQTIKKYENLQSQQQMLQAQKSSFNRSMTPFDDNVSHHTNVFRDNLTSSARSNLSYSEQEIVDILAKIRGQTALGEHMVVERMKTLQLNGNIAQEQFLGILVKEGNISQADAQRVVAFFTLRGQVSIQRFEDFLRQAQQIQAYNSVSLQKFIKLIQNAETSESVARALMGQDIDKDGLLRLDGFKAALLSPEFRLGVDEVVEIFQIMAKQGLMVYKDILIEYNQNLRNLLLGNLTNAKTINTPSVMSQHVRSEASLLNAGPSIQSQATSIFVPPNANLTSEEDVRLRIIKNRLKQYMQEQDITLGTLFKLIDTNSDSQLSISEFKQKMRALHIQLDDSELQTLFQHLDKTSRGWIDYNVFVQEFPEINISYMMKKIKNIIIGSKVAPEAVFNEFCTDKKHQQMNQGDFKRFVKKYIEKAADHEIDSLFKHFSGVGVVAGIANHLSKADFNEAFSREVRDLQMKVNCNIEDIIKPLKTKIDKFKVNVAQLFERYDKNQNRRLSAEELAYALSKDMNMVLAEDEIQAIKEYFKNKHKATEINEMDFMELLNMKFYRVYEEKDAKVALQLVKQRIHTVLGKTAFMICKEFDVEGLKRLSMRNFKHALHSLRVLNQNQIDNLTKYLDTEDDGFISVDKFDQELRIVMLPVAGGAAHTNTMGSVGGPQSAGSTLNKSLGTGHTKKWSKKE